MGSKNISMAFEKESKPFTFNNYKSSLLVNSIHFSTHSLRVHYKLATILIGVGDSGMNLRRPRLTKGLTLIRLHRGFM